MGSNPRWYVSDGAVMLKVFLDICYPQPGRYGL